MFQTAITPAEGIELGPMGLVLAVLLLAWLVFGEAISGRTSFRRFLSALDAGVPDARRDLYRSWSGMAWALAAGVVALAALSPGFGLARLGFSWPQWSSLAAASAGSSFVKGLLIGMVLMVVASIVLGALAVRKIRSGAAPAPQATSPAVSALLPRTPEERRGYAALSLTAGITEEIVQRGFLLAAMVALLPPLPALAYVLVGAVVFGLGHAYQGLSGVVATGLMGGLFMGTYLATGSLLVPIVLHVLMDLNGLRVHAQAEPSPDG